MENNIITPQNDTSPTLTPETPITPPIQNPKKSKKPLIVGLVVLVLLIAALLWFFVFNKSDTPANNSGTPSPDQTTDSSDQPKKEKITYYMRQGNDIMYLDETGALKKFATLAKNERAIEVVIIDGKPEVRYVVETQKTVNGFTSTTGWTAYGRADTSGKKELFKFKSPENIDSFAFLPMLSPDKKSVIVETQDDNGLMTDISVITVADGKSRQVYKPSDNKAGFYSFVDWNDNNSVLLQSQTCRNCDGPLKPTLNRLNLSDGKISTFIDLDSNKLSVATFEKVHNRKNLYMVAGDFSLWWGDLNPKTNYGSSFVYLIDKTSNQPKKLVEFPDNNYPESLGVNQDGSGTYVLHNKKVLLVKDGSQEDMKVDAEKIKKGSTVKKVFEDSNNLYIVVGVIDENDFEVYSIYKKVKSSGNITSLGELTNDNWFYDGLMTTVE